MSKHAEAKVPPQDFDIPARGFNVLLGLLLPRVGRFNGAPIAENTPDVRNVAMSLLHPAGRHVLLSRTADIVRHGMVADSDVAVARLLPKKLDARRISCSRFVHV